MNQKDEILAMKTSGEFEQNKAGAVRQIDTPMTGGFTECSGWQRMDTAPKDRFIFLYCREDNSRWLAKWQGDRWYGVDDMGLSRAGHSEGDPEVVTGWAVNAWQPLPAPPVTP